MSYYSSIKLEGKDSASLDAFGRWRVSDPVGIFDCQFTYDRAMLQWQEINNGGSSTHLPNESAVEMTTGATTSGNYAYRQTWRHFRYQPGKSQLILHTGVMGAKKTSDLIPLCHPLALDDCQVAIKPAPALGDRFDIRAFHDVILGNGSLPLAVVEKVVDDWVATVASSEDESAGATRAR